MTTKRHWNYYHAAAGCTNSATIPAPLFITMKVNQTPVNQEANPMEDQSDREGRGRRNAAAGTITAVNQTPVMQEANHVRAFSRIFAFVASSSALAFRVILAQFRVRWEGTKFRAAVGKLEPK